MSQKSANRPSERLSAARTALQEVARLAQCGEATFKTAPPYQHAISYCWVAAGSALKDYATIVGIGFEDEIIKSAIHFRDRLAHQALDKMRRDIVWKTSVHDGPEILAVVEAFIANTDPRWS